MKRSRKQPRRARATTSRTLHQQELAAVVGGYECHLEDQNGDGVDETEHCTGSPCPYNQ